MNKKILEKEEESLRKRLDMNWSGSFRKQSNYKSDWTYAHVEAPTFEKAVENILCKNALWTVLEIRLAPTTSKGAMDTQGVGGEKQVWLKQ